MNNSKMLSIPGFGWFDVMSTTTENSNNTLLYNLGNNRSGEIYNQGAMFASIPGLYSKPMGPGTFSGTSTSPQFTASQFSPTSAQSFVMQTNSRWTVLGGRDVRLQSLLPSYNPGETLLVSEGLPNNYHMLTISGTQTMQAPTSITQSVISGEQIQVTKTNVDLGSNPNDYLALASKVDNIMTLLKTLAQQLAIPVPAVVGNPTLSPAAITAATNLATGILSVASTVIKAK
jgi:hypothetical protein